MSSENEIRKVSVARAILIENEDGTTTEKSLNLIVGVEHTIYIDSQKIKRRICNIEETKNHVLIYLEDGSASQLWKKLPKNDQTSIEYKID